LKIREEPERQDDVSSRSLEGSAPRMFRVHDFTAGLSKPAPAHSTYRCDRCRVVKAADEYLYIRGSRSCTCLSCQAHIEARIRASVLRKQRPVKST
jgi:hypothetical protein